MKHKAGFVNIIGKPNVGKSTMMNSMVGERLSIITNKAQTTRHRIMGIVSGEDFQIVYSDTPGVLTPNYKLQEKMMRFVDSAFQDADVLLVMVEIGEKEMHPELKRKITQANLPILLCINKIDLEDQSLVMEKIEYWQKEFPKADIMPVSALHKFNLESVFNKILDLLPESPAYYNKEEVTDKSMRFIMSEIIREKILIHYKKEIPYSVEVIIEEYKDEEKIVKISSVVYIARESQKHIIIGKDGLGIKRFASEARKDMEAFIQKKVFLEVRVKVSKDWKNNEAQLKRFGYND